MRKGQMNIDFIVSMGIFVGVFVLYVYNFTDVVSRHFLTLHELELESSCLSISNTLAAHLTEEGFRLNESYYRDVIEKCESPIPGTVSEGMYTTLRRQLGAGERDINIILTYFLVAPTTDVTKDGYHAGVLRYNGSVYDVIVFNSTSGKFDRVNISGGDLPSPVYDLMEGSYVSFKGENFRVERIDPAGNFVLFYKKIADCGIKPALEERYTRYSFFEKYKGHPVRVDVICK